MRVLATPDYRMLSLTAAEFVVNAARAKPDLTLGLPTGMTPKGMYAKVIEKYQNERLDLSRLKTFNLDEYLDMPQSHPKSYHTYMRHHFFDHVNIPPANIHIPDGSPGTDEDAESRKYERAIQDAGGIDLLIIGVGANGHIGFNEPGSAFDSRTRAVRLTPQTMINARQHFGDEPVATRAITMGIGTILEARQILLLASGAGKTDVVDRALHGPMTESVPASALQGHRDVTVVLDEATINITGENGV